MVWRSGQAYSDDLRGRVRNADGSARAVAARFGVSVSYVVRARQRRDRHGELNAGPQASRTPRLLAGLYDAIARHIRAHDEATLDQLRAWLREAHGVSVSMGLMWNTVARLGLTLKNVWPAPSATVISDGVLVCINVSGLRASTLAKMGSARPGPHKDRGVEHHIFQQAAETPVRPLSHLSSPPQTSFAASVLPTAILDQAIAAWCS